MVRLVGAKIKLLVSNNLIRKSIDNVKVKLKLQKAFEGKSIDANFIKNFLEENGIKVLLKDDTMGLMFPLFVEHGGINPVKVFVSNEDLEKAKTIIADYFG